MKKLAVLSGAGVSKESGINTFRDSGGLWEKYPVQQVASIEGWYADRALVLDFYNARRRDIKDRRPNKAHRLIAGLEKYFQVTVITQNIDNLHEQAGSTNVIHLHGEVTKAIGEGEDPTDPSNITDIGYGDIRIGDKSRRGNQLRPFIVWFGEPVPMIGRAASVVSECDMLLVIGTSLNVYPAAGLVNYIKYGTPLWLIDPNPIRVDYSNYTQITDVATSGMEKFTEMLLNGGLADGQE